MRCQVGDVLQITKETIDSLPPWFNKSRWKEGCYLVVAAVMQDDGWHVSARKMRKSGHPNPSGWLITFYQSGPSSIPLTSLPIVSKI